MYLKCVHAFHYMYTSVCNSEKEDIQSDRGKDNRIKSKEEPQIKRAHFKTLVVCKYRISS